MLHAASPGFKSFGVRTTQWQVCNLYAVLSRFGVPVFVMISGMFLLDPNRNYTIKKLYLSKIARIAMAYLFWSTFYAIVFLIFKVHHGASLSNHNLLHASFQQFLIGRVHLWFLFMISGLYIITPILRNIVTDEKLTIYYLILSLIFVFSVNSLNLIPQAQKVLALTINRLDVKLVAGYSGCFVWGYYLSTHHLNGKIRIIIYIVGLVSAITAVGINGLAGYHFNQRIDWTLKNLILNTLCMATAVFVFFQYHFQDVHFSLQTQRVLALLGKWSFGIFLVHMFFHSYIVPRFFIHPILSIPLSSIITFLLSLVTVFALSKIQVLNTHIM